MGCAEVISLPEVRARKQWDTLQAQKFRRLLELRHHNVNQINDSKN